MLYSLCHVTLYMPAWRNLVDAKDLKSFELYVRAGSSPAAGILHLL